MSFLAKPFHKFMFLWMGDFISAIGSGLTSFGLGVYIFQQTGKTSLMALVTLLGFLPSILLSIPAGVLADRYDRRLLMVIGDSCSAIGLLFILFCMRNGEAEFWQICVGVVVSSVFASLLEPAYRATITDLLPPSEFSKASGLMQVVGSAKYLISPVLAGFLLTIFDIRILLVIDICTFFVTVGAILVVRKGIARKAAEVSESFSAQMREGLHAVTENKGIFLLVVMGSLITFCIGFLQTLSSPMVLSFESSATLGTLMSVIASGMLLSSILLGSVSVKKGYVRMLCLSLFGAGIFMAIFGLRANIWLIGIGGFLFFAMLPFANTSLDFLIRTGIPNELQGRAWGFIGFLSQIGYVVAYAISGLLADYVFTPMLMPEGLLSGTVGILFGTGVGRGIGLLIFLAGALLCVTAIILGNMKTIRNLEGGTNEI